ncbi:MAG: hypothetical protein WCF18_17085 [Chthoniobacteraceae bacterium]
MSKSRSPRVVSPAVSRHSSIERLEDRIAPANNVVTVFSGGTLTITTVDQLGEAEVNNGDNNQTFEIDGTAPGNVTVHKSSVTTINGGVADVLFTGVTNVVVDLKLGADSVTCKTLDIAGDLTMKGGEGGNALTLDGTGGTTKIRNVSFINGNGNDYFVIQNGKTVISSKLTLNFGGGESSSNIGTNPADDVSIGGDLKVTGGAGLGVNFAGHDVSVNGSLGIKSGNGTGVTVNTGNSFVIGKAVKLVNGNGNIQFTVGNNTNKSSSFAGISIKNGTGNTTVRFASTVADAIDGDLTVTNGTGAHLFQVNSKDFSVTGKVSLANGNGDNETKFATAGSITVGGSLTVTNKAGLDNFTATAAVVNFKDVKVSNGNGGSTTTLSGASLSFASVSVANGDGTDAFQVSSTNSFQVTKGGLSLKNGSGGSSTAINVNVIAGIAGALSIVNGDGMDTTVIGGGSGNFSGLHAVTISNGAGGSSLTFNPAQLTIAGALSVTSGAGSDTVTIGGGALTSFSIAGSVKVANGGGGSVVQALPTTAGMFARDFSVTGGDGNDTVSLSRVTVKGATKLVLGSNSDFVTMDDSMIGALSIDTGTGDDMVTIESNDGVGTTLLGAVSIKLGAGDDRLTFGIDPNDSVTASAALKFDGGTGLDTFNQTGAANNLAVPPVLTAFEVELP